jgi:hypothetical protein
MVEEEYYTICDDILTREVFELIAPDHREPYSYEGLCDAILSYNARHTEKVFGMGTPYQRAAELAAFLGNTLHESDEFRAGREYLMCADHKIVNDVVYCKPCDSGSFDWATFTCPQSLITGTAEFNEYCQPSSVPPEACHCGDGRGQSGDLEGYVPASDLYFGRGAIQLSWNYNYIGASVALTGSAETFCENPDLVATEGRYAWGAGIYFWMEHSKEGTTCHMESLKMDFGGTLNNINGGLECPAHGGWHEEAVKMRLNRYCRASKALGLPNLMTLSRCAGLEEKMTACLADGTCTDCQDYVGTRAGDTPADYSPPVPTGLPAANVVEESVPSGTEESLFDALCGEGLMALPGRPECCVPNTHFVGDGACDPEEPYNTAACMWDGGDCCKETCKTDSPFGCKTKEGDALGAYGPFGFYCLDPSQGDDAVVASQCNGDDKERIGDGKCNQKYNTEACNFDGGDCCEETCDNEFGFYPCGSGLNPYQCVDPRFQVQSSAPTVHPTPNPVQAMTRSPTANPVFISTHPPTKSPTSNPTKSLTTAAPTQKAPNASNPQLSDSFASSPSSLKDESCPSDFKECKNGIIVGRDPDKGCRFKSCESDEAEINVETTASSGNLESEMLCPSDFKECDGGIFVSRNPIKNCQFNPCPIEEKETNLEVSEPPKKQCPSDFKECPGTGIFVSRDPLNGCRYKTCPTKEENIEKEDDPDKHQFSSLIEAAMQGEKIEKDEELIICPQDVQECPDGSFVGRDSTKGCKYFPCKTLSETLCAQDMRECRDGTFVGRDPLNGCQFKSCADSIASQNGNAATGNQSGLHSKTSIASSVSESLGGLHHKKGSGDDENIDGKSSPIAAGSTSSSIAKAIGDATVVSVDTDPVEIESHESIAQTISETNSAIVDSETRTYSESPEIVASLTDKASAYGVSHGKSNVHKKGHM